MTTRLKRILSLIGLAILLSTLACGGPESPPSQAAQVSQARAYEEAIVSLQDSLAKTRAVLDMTKTYRISPRLAETAVDAALANGIDPKLFGRLVAVESGWNPLARGPVGEVGLTQIRPSTAGLPVDSLMDPATNLHAGAAYLGIMLDRFDSTYDALRAYNAGPSAARRWDTAGDTYATVVLNETWLEGGN